MLKYNSKQDNVAPIHTHNSNIPFTQVIKNQIKVFTNKGGIKTQGLIIEQITPSILYERPYNHDWSIRVCKSCETFFDRSNITVDPLQLELFE